MSRYPKPSVTVDIVVFSVFDDTLKLLLIKRGKPPFKGEWALPGGFVDINEPLEVAARRELEEETGLRGVALEQLYTFGDPGRDPRGWTISVVYYTLVNADRVTPQAATDAAAVDWFSALHPPHLAFDHRGILRSAVARLRQSLEWTTVGMDAMPKRFRLADLKRLYEAILQHPVDTRWFKKKILSQGQISAVNRTRLEKGHRSVQLYRFRRRRSQRSVGLGGTGGIV